MDGYEHFREAERLLAISTADNPVTAAEAQVHATLALAWAVSDLHPKGAWLVTEGSKHGG